MENSTKNVELIDRFLENERKSRAWTTITIAIFCLLGLVVFWLAFELNKSNAKFKLQNIELKKTQDSLDNALGRLDQNVQSLTQDSVSASLRVGNYDSLKKAFDTVVLLFKKAQEQHDIKVNDLSSQQISSTIQTAIDPTKESKPSNPFVIYVQYMPDYKKVSQDVTNDLTTHGYTIPGQQQITNSTFDPIVKYFHDEDKAKAEEIAKLINAENGYLADHPARAQKQDLKSPLHQIEIWIGKYQPTKLYEILQQQPSVLQKKEAAKLATKKIP